MFSQRAQNGLFDIRIPNKTCVFFSFCFLVLLDMVRVHAKAGPWGRPHAAYPIRSFERTFFTLQKKTLLSKGTLEICTRARPKTLPKKTAKKTRSGVPPEQRTPRQDQKMKKCVTCKSQNPGDSTHRKLHHERDPERPAPTRQPKKRFVKKTCFFSKTCVFQFKKARAANFGASLRRPNWPCLEYLLLFYKTFFKKCAPPCAT